MDRFVGAAAAVAAAATLWAEAAPAAPIPDQWTATSASGAPSARQGHVAVVVSGGLMLVWGGIDSAGTHLASGGLFDPGTNTWIAAPNLAAGTGAPSGRVAASVVSTGTRVIVWGGNASSVKVADGGVYDVASDTWAPMATLGAPSAREDGAAVWTGSRMVLWGGAQGSPDNSKTGGIYDPSLDVWVSAPNLNAGTGAPLARNAHEVVWTGAEMIVFGGAEVFNRLANGGIYVPATDTWRAAPALETGAGSPGPRSGHAQHWTGAAMLVWGGTDGPSQPDTGGLYDPASDAWLARPNLNAGTGAPPGREDFGGGALVGGRLVIWGGGSSGGRLATGGIYDVAGDTWSAPPGLNGAGAPPARSGHTIVAVGDRVVVWGGTAPFGVVLSSGGIYGAPPGSSGGSGGGSGGALAPAASLGGGGGCRAGGPPGLESLALPLAALGLAALARRGRSRGPTPSLDFRDAPVVPTRVRPAAGASSPGVRRQRRRT
jgi:hypothetical protein